MFQVCAVPSLCLSILTRPALPRRHRLSDRRGTGPPENRPGQSLSIKVRPSSGLKYQLPRPTVSPPTKQRHPRPRTRPQRIRGRVRHR
jgi:hypothetical protein